MSAERETINQDDKFNDAQVADESQLIGNAAKFAGGKSEHENAEDK